MSRGPYDVGDSVRISASFRDLNGLFVTPTTVTLRLRNKTTNELQTPSPTLDAVGKYHADFTLPSAGVWVIRWQGTGAVATAEQTEIIVEADDTL